MKSPARPSELRSRRAERGRPSCRRPSGISEFLDSLHGSGYALRQGNSQASRLIMQRLQQVIRFNGIIGVTQSPIQNRVAKMLIGDVIQPLVVLHNMFLDKLQAFARWQKALPQIN